MCSKPSLWLSKPNMNLTSNFKKIKTLLLPKTITFVIKVIRAWNFYVWRHINDNDRAWTLLTGQVSSTYIWTLVFQNLYRSIFIMNTSNKTAELNCFWNLVFHTSSTTKIFDTSKQFTVLFIECIQLEDVILLKINAISLMHLPGTIWLCA